MVWFSETFHKIIYVGQQLDILDWHLEIVLNLTFLCLLFWFLTDRHGGSQHNQIKTEAMSTFPPSYVQIKRIPQSWKLIKIQKHIILQLFCCLLPNTKYLLLNTPYKIPIPCPASSGSSGSFLPVSLPLFSPSPVNIKDRIGHACCILYTKIHLHFVH